MTETFFWPIAFSSMIFFNPIFCFGTNSFFKSNPRCCHHGPKLKFNEELSLTIFNLLVLLVVPAPSCGQLLGHFSFVPLPDGYEYRDGETVAASQQAARLGERVYREEEFQADSRRRSNEYNILSNIVPQFETSSHGLKIGRTLHDSKIFDRWDTNFLNPFTETRSNKPLEELLVEDHTSPIRLLPGEGLPPTPPPPTRLPVNRLQNRNRPLEESERAKNSRLGTIFDKKKHRPSPGRDQFSGIRENTHITREHPTREHFPGEHFTKEQLPKEHFNKEHFPREQFNKEHFPVEHFKKEHLSREHLPREHFTGKHLTREHLPGEHFIGEHLTRDHLTRQHIPIAELTQQIDSFKETRPAATFFGTLHSSG